MPNDVLRQFAALASVDAEARTAEVVFSTGSEVMHQVVHRGRVRWMPTRVELSADAADLSFLNRGAPVLIQHDNTLNAVVGVVEQAWLTATDARARLRFSRAPEVASVWQRIEEGVLRHVSMGFLPLRQEAVTETGADGAEREVIVFRGWQPIEISLVPVPGDRGAQVQGDDAIMRTEETEMPTEVEQRPAPVPGVDGDGLRMTQAAGAGPVAVAPADADAIRQAERRRITEIGEVADALGLAQGDRQAAVADGTSADEFRRAAIRLFAERGQAVVAGVARPAVRLVADERDRFAQGVAAGIAARAGMAGGERNEFSGMTLAELARQSLRIAGVAIPHDRLTMVGMALTQAHSTSDFANVLANVAHKAALAGWSAAPETWPQWTRAGSLTDFRPAKRVGLALPAALPTKLEGVDYQYGTIGDRGETITLATYGRILRFTREAIINDDLSILSTVPSRMGAAARRTVGNLVYAVLTANAAMADGVALFHSSHGNLAGSGAVPSVTTMGAAKAAMMVQASGGHALNIVPKYMIVPAALELSARQLLTSTVDPTASKGHAANPVAGMAELVVDARLDAASATAWYLAADPTVFDTIEVAFLDGRQEPFMEQQPGWTTDAIEWKVRIDAAAAALDHRTLYKNAGA